MNFGDRSGKGGPVRASRAPARSYRGQPDDSPASSKPCSTAGLARLSPVPAVKSKTGKYSRPRELTKEDLKFVSRELTKLEVKEPENPEPRISHERPTASNLSVRTQADSIRTRTTDSASVRPHGGSVSSINSAWGEDSLCDQSSARSKPSAASNAAPSRAHERPSWKGGAMEEMRSTFMDTHTDLNGPIELARFGKHTRPGLNQPAAATTTTSAPAPMVSMSTATQAPARRAKASARHAAAKRHGLGAAATVSRTGKRTGGRRQTRQKPARRASQSLTRRMAGHRASHDAVDGYASAGDSLPLGRSSSMGHRHVGARGRGRGAESMSDGEHTDGDAMSVLSADSDGRDVLSGRMWESQSLPADEGGVDQEDASTNIISLHADARSVADGLRFDTSTMRPTHNGDWSSAYETWSDAGGSLTQHDFSDEDDDGDDGDGSVAADSEDDTDDDDDDDDEDEDSVLDGLHAVTDTMSVSSAGSRKRNRSIDSNSGRRQRRTTPSSLSGRPMPRHSPARASSQAPAAAPVAAPTHVRVPAQAPARPPAQARKPAERLGAEPVPFSWRGAGQDESSFALDDPSFALIHDTYTQRVVGESNMSVGSGDGSLPSMGMGSAMWGSRSSTGDPGEVRLSRY